MFVCLAGWQHDAARQQGRVLHRQVSQAVATGVVPATEEGQAPLQGLAYGWRLAQMQSMFPLGPLHSLACINNNIGLLLASQSKVSINETCPCGYLLQANEAQVGTNRAYCIGYLLQ